MLREAGDDKLLRADERIMERNEERDSKRRRKAVGNADNAVRGGVDNPEAVDNRVQQQQGTRNAEVDNRAQQQQSTRNAEVDNRVQQQQGTRNTEVDNECSKMSQCWGQCRATIR
jgi:hypothetical protein